MAKPFNRGIKLGYDAKSVNGQPLKIYEFNDDFKIVRASGTTAATNLDSQAVFAKGAFYTKTDAATGVKAVYENVGTTSSSSFNLLGEAVAGDITLAEGNLLVGNNSGVAVALDIGNTDKGIAIGNGTTATIAALSGDATMTNGGVVTVASAAGTFGTPGTTTSSGAAAVAITGSIHEITSTGANALTLADGAEGQHLNVVYVAEGAGGDVATLTPSNLAGANTTITFNDLGDAAHLLFTAGAWYFLGGEAVVAV